MIPVARSEELLIQQVGDELIVYDEENNGSYCLNPMAARVWHYCDGQHTVKDIAKLLEKELDIPGDEDVDTRGLVWLTLEELERFGLIKEYVKQPIGASGISRRTVIKTGALVGGFAVGSIFPLVQSIVAPTSAMAVSGGQCTVNAFGICVSNPAAPCTGDCECVRINDDQGIFDRCECRPK